MKLPFTSLVLALCLGSTQIGVAGSIVANFEGGDSYKTADAYVGRAGDGWKGPWKPQLYGTNIFAETKPDPSGTGNSLDITMTSTSDKVEGNKQATLWREFDGKGDVEVGKPLQYTFSVRPISELDPKQRIVIFNRTGGPHSGTDASDTWAISAASTGWKLGNEDAGLSVDPGKTYTFTIKVNPAARTWVGIISEGANTYTSGVLPFRVDSVVDGTFLHFGGGVNGVDQKVEFAISSIEISAQH